MQILLVALAAIYAQAASLQITPTTTLNAETTNNTSTAATWKTSSSGDLGASNVSKVDHRTLLYPGASTQIYTNIMYWFGPSNHIQVGYKSNDYQQVKAQIDDHLSRGINGTIVDWYGTAHTVDNGGTLYLKQYAESLAGYPFKFAIMEDKGALGSCANTSGCDVNAQLLSDLTYIVNTYGASPAYMKFNGRPVIFFFAVESYNINWSWVKANVPGNPLFIFENGSGYSRTGSDGGFGWVMINTSDQSDWKQSYLDSFYATALNYQGTEHTFGATYKGFNDTLASWSLNRIMSQQCGQVWLRTWNEVGRYYNANKQLESMQIVTWNDYEEGTEIESGIDNCVSISAAVSGDELSWAITGNENTLDHYTVFISIDGQNLMPLASVTPGIHTLELSEFELQPGSYTIYVKAVGKPSMLNHMSAAAAYTVADQKPSVVLSITPGSGIAPVTVAASTAGSTAYRGSISQTVIDFGDGYNTAAASASHMYSAPGTYTITATVTDSFGLWATRSANVNVAANQPPQAYLAVTPALGSVPLVVTASTAGSKDVDGSITSSTIDFGDGTLVAGSTASHTYSKTGTYIIKAVVADNMGAASQASATVTVNPVLGGGTVDNRHKWPRCALSSTVCNQGNNPQPADSGPGQLATPVYTEGQHGTADVSRSPQRNGQGVGLDVSGFRLAPEYHPRSTEAAAPRFVLMVLEQPDPRADTDGDTARQQSGGDDQQVPQRLPR